MSMRRNPETVETIGRSGSPHPLLEKFLPALLLLGLLLTAAPSGADSYKAEAIIGDRLAAAGFQRYGMPLKDDALQTYVNRVGTAVARNTGRPDTPFYFAVLDNDRIIASWSCPAGIVAVTSGFLRIMADEAELAGVLAHEAAHVSGRHALKSYKRSDVKGPAKDLPGLIERLSHIVFQAGLLPSLEHAADRRSLETTFRTGYDPAGMLRLLSRLQTLPETARQPGSWFRTHPPLNVRIDRCRSRLNDLGDRSGLATAARRFEKMRERIE